MYAMMVDLRKDYPKLTQQTNLKKGIWSRLIFLPSVFIQQWSFSYWRWTTGFVSRSRLGSCANLGFCQGGIFVGKHLISLRGGGNSLTIDITIL